MEAKFQAWNDSAMALLSDVRQREEQLREAQQEQIEQVRLVAEAAEKLKKEKAEAKRKAESERERVESEQAERLRREQAETEERMHREGTAEAAQEQALKETDVAPRLAFPSADDDVISNEDNSGTSSSVNCSEYDLSAC